MYKYSARKYFNSNDRFGFNTFKENTNLLKKRKRSSVNKERGCYYKTKDLAHDKHWCEEEGTMNTIRDENLTNSKNSSNCSEIKEMNYNLLDYEAPIKEFIPLPDNGEIIRPLDKRSHNSDRFITDIYWCSLFVVVFSIWVASCSYALHQIDFKTNSLNCTKVHDQFPYFVGKNWIFDTITCNAVLLSAHYHNNGPIVIWANVLFCGSLIGYSLSSMRNDALFYKQLSWTAMNFGMLSIGLRVAYITEFIPHHEDSISPFVPSHEKLQFWIMPEMIFFIILYTKRSHSVDFIKKISNELHLFDMFDFYHSKVFFVIALLLSLLTVFTAVIVAQLNSSYVLFYVIVGGSCYIGLTIIYFILMVYACAINFIMNDADLLNQYTEHVKWKFNVVLRASAIVCRYHFGTVCYHATLIFPRLKTLFISNDPEVKKITEFTKFTNLHNLSLVTTAICGSDHRESIKKLSRVFDEDLSKLEYFQGFSKTSRCLLALLMSTNMLMLISLWIFGIDDTRLSFSTWSFYLGLMFIVSGINKICDVAFDTILFYMEHSPVDYPTKRLLYVTECWIK